MRAYLIVRPEAAARRDAAASGADALMVDFADFDPRCPPRDEAQVPSPVRERDRVRVPVFPERSVPSPQPSPGRERGPVEPTGDFSENGPGVIAGIGALDRPETQLTLASAMAIAPAAVALPVAHGRDVAHLGALLAVHEAENGLPDGATRIIALIASAAGALNAGSLVAASPRLIAIGWDAAAIADELHAESLDAAGGWSAPLAQLRSLVRLAAAAACVEAIEAAYPGDAAGLSRHLAAARRDGFDAVLAASPAQVAFIHEA